MIARQSFKTFVARFFLGLLISGAFQVPSQQTISRFFMILLALGRSLVVSGSLRQGISLWHRGSWLLGWCPSLADYGTGMEPTAGDHRRTGARVGYALDDSIRRGRNSTRGGPSCPTESRAWGSWRSAA